MSYTTQMDAARQGIITPEMKAVAASEHIAEDELRELIALGQVIIPANKNHKCLKPNGIGSRLRTKINVNLGTSRDWTDLDMEMEKVKSAVDMGAEAIMDLSSCGDTQKFRRKLTSECPATIGTVPIYDAVVYYHKALQQQEHPLSVCRTTMLRTLRYKLIYRTDGEHELYDLEKDPKELCNVYGQEEYAAVSLKLERDMLRWYAATSDTVPMTSDSRE